MQAPLEEYFLISKGRQKIVIVGERNCLFRALSQQMCKSEVHHSILHTTIVRFELMKQGMFQPYLIPAGSITLHAKKMIEPRV